MLIRIENGAEFKPYTLIRIENEAEFKAWIAKVKASPKTIPDFAAYRELAKPSINDPVSYYSDVPNSLFNSVVTQYPGGMMPDMKMDGEHMKHGQNSNHQDNEHQSSTGKENGHEMHMATHEG